MIMLFIERDVMITPELIVSTCQRIFHYSFVLLFTLTGFRQLYFILHTYYPSLSLSVAVYIGYLIQAEHTLLPCYLMIYSQYDEIVENIISNKYCVI